MSIFRRRSSGEDKPAPAAQTFVPDGTAAGPPPSSASISASASPPGGETLDLNEGETRWLEGLREAIPGAPTLTPEQLGALYDDLLGQWQAERGDPNNAINALGAALGDAVAARVPGARWAIFSDVNGADLAVTSTAHGGPMIFPMAAVAKRWTAGERGWFAPYVEWAAAQLGGGGAGAEPEGEPPSTELVALAELAIGHAMNSIVPGGGPLVPFCLVEKVEGRELHRFAGELGQAVEHAREFARGSGAVRAAVAWDGYLTVDGERSDALFVEASDPGQPSLVLAHRYQETRDGTHAVGERTVLHRGAPVL